MFSVAGESLIKHSDDLAPKGDMGLRVVAGVIRGGGRGRLTLSRKHEQRPIYAGETREQANQQDWLIHDGRKEDRVGMARGVRLCRPE